MKMLSKLKYLNAIVVALLLLCGVTITAYADSPSFTYNYPVDDVEFRLYNVGKVINNEFLLNDDFSQYQVDLEEKTAPETLAAYVERDSIMPCATGVTANGSVVFSDLEPVIYLMLGEIKEVDRVRWIPKAVLFSIPQKDDEGHLIWDVVAEGKYDTEEIPEEVEISVEKIWKDAGYENERPASIRAQLLKDGEVYDTVELSKANNWKYTWKKLDSEYNWTVVEEKVPVHYSVSTDKADGVKLLINKRDHTRPTPTPNPHIPYTGQLWWPVGILIVAGLGLILIGLIRRKKSEK